MRRLALAVVCLAMLAVPAAGDAPAAAALTGRPVGLKDVQQRLIDLSRSLDRLVAEANRDPRERRIAQYENYSSKELESTKRDVRAKDLVEWMVDPNLNFLARQAASKAILDGVRKSADVDLSADEKKGSMSARAWFFKEYVVEHLKHDDAKSRKLASDLLNEVWRPGGVADIVTYKVDDSKTWSKARSAWLSLLKKR